MNTLSQLRSIYADLVDRYFTVNAAGDDCFVVTALSSNPLNPMFPLLDVSLISATSLQPIKMLDQSSPESVFVYASTQKAVKEWLDALVVSDDVQFPITSDVDALQRYYDLVGTLNEE